MSEDGFTEIDLGYSPIPDRCRRRLDEVPVKKDGVFKPYYSNGNIEVKAYYEDGKEKE